MRTTRRVRTFFHLPKPLLTNHKLSRTLMEHIDDTGGAGTGTYYYLWWDISDDVARIDDPKCLEDIVLPLNDDDQKLKCTTLKPLSWGEIVTVISQDRETVEITEVWRCDTGAHTLVSER
ncbi:MAG: hypothetical protein MMC33_005013 [Icmadophila ericetorum]|nr:hypothetical protein [Icmadophila ericetorum]